LALVAWGAIVGSACASGGGALSAPVAGPAPDVSATKLADAGADLVDAAPSQTPIPPTASAPPPSPSVACAAKCSGTGTGDLVAFAMQRAAQAKPCYDRALGNDGRLRGSMEVLVRLADTGAVCATRVLKTSMPADVNDCVTRVLGGADYPPPKGGCLDVSIPLSFVPKDADAGVIDVP
jgi:hypothetical protein